MDGLGVFVLAGGLGTRLRAVTGDRPKALMPVGGQPFLRRFLTYLHGQGIGECVLCLGYRAEEIMEYFSAEPVAGLILKYSVEPVPLGTAGAVRYAQAHWSDNNLILNGDTELAFDFPRFYAHHLASNAAVTVGLVQVDDAARFGRVRLEPGGPVSAFLEKDGVHTAGLVNAGLYLCSRPALYAIPATGPASVEHDWLPQLLAEGLPVQGLVVAQQFVDIGTPEDYWRLVNQG